MILVDTSVWIDWLADRRTRQVGVLSDTMASGEPVIVADLVLMELLQGARGERHAERILSRMIDFQFVPTTTPGMTVQAARHYRSLRALGITVRKTIDTLIATRCIIDGIPLLYSDRDFDPFVEHLGLLSALDRNESL